MFAKDILENKYFLPAQESNKLQLNFGFNDVPMHQIIIEGTKQRPKRLLIFLDNGFVYHIEHYSDGIEIRTNAEFNLNDQNEFDIVPNSWLEE